MTPEQVCEVLVKAGVIERCEDWHIHKWYTLGDFSPAMRADRLIADGNVAMAAWEAVKAKYPSCRYSQTTFANGSTRVAVIECGKPKHFWVDGTDTAALTTACAMALANKEERL